MSGFLRAVARIFSYTRLRTGLIAAMLLLTLVAGWGVHHGTPAYATSVTPANTLNFQARLQMSNGSIAADGAYNIRFRLYDAPSAGNLLWTETYLVSAGDGLDTTNGYFSTDLGSVSPFSSNINWGQQLYLTMEVGGTDSTPAWDGEMDPRLNLTSVPSAFALNNYDSDTGYVSSLRLGAPTSGDQTFTVPDQGAAGDYTLLTQQAANGYYIQNTGSTPQTASAYLTGAVKSQTALLAPSIDTITAGTLHIGQTNATAISLDQNTTVAAGKTLTLAGGATAGRPVGPSEGTLYYDTSTHQMLAYNGTKWVASQKTSIIVAASNASQAAKDSADFVAAGTNDQTTIANAVSVLANGGTVYLLAGTYNFGGSLNLSANNVVLTGDTAAVINRGFNGSASTDGGLIIVSGTGDTVSKLELNGQGSTYTNTAYNTGIILKGASDTALGLNIHDMAANGIATASSSSAVITANNIENNAVGIYDADAGTTITGNYVSGNSGDGIAALADAVITGNQVLNNAGSGITFNATAAASSQINSNVINTNGQYGIYVQGSATGLALTANSLYNNGGSGSYDGIRVDGGTGLSITNNIINDTAGTGYAINIYGSSVGAYLSANVYGGTGAASVNNNSSQTVYGGQLSAPGDYVIQADDSISLSSNTTVSGDLTVTGSIAYRKGIDFTATGTSNDIDFGAGALFRLTGTSTQTITGIAGGTDGRILTLVNAAAQAAILSNNSTSSASGNRIITGTGADLTIAAGASVSLVYDSGSSVWRIVGTISGTVSGGSYVTLQGTSPGTADSGNLAINGSAVANQVGIGTGTNTLSRQLEVDVNSSSITSLPVLIKQSGVGDTGVEYQSAGADYFTGVDSTDGAFKISSSMAAQGSTFYEGYTTQGSVTDQNAMATQATKMTATASGTVQSISVWLGYVGTSPNAQVGLYADNGSGTAPGALLTTSAITAAQADSLNTFPVTPVSITNGATYWIALSTQSADTYYGDTGGTTLYRTGDGYPLPTSFSANANSSARLSLYATVTTTGGMIDEFGSQALFSLSNSGQLQLHNYMDSTSAFSIQNAAGSSLFNVDTTNSSIAINGSVAYRKGADFATTGTNNDVDFGAGALFRLTGTSTQTITGIAGGADGRIMTLVNAASQAATLANNSSSSSAANRIVTGTGSDLNIAAGASVSLVYDSGSSLWRVVGTISGTVSGGSYITLQGTSPGTADSGNFNVTGTGIAGALQAATFDTAAAGALTIGGTNATSITLGHAGITTTITGLSYQLNSAGTSTINAGGTLSLTAAGSSKFTTTSGDMTLGTNAYTGKLILQAIGANGIVSVGDNTAPTITIGSGTNTTRTISIGHANTSTNATVSIGSQGTVNIGSTDAATTTNTTNINTTTSATGTQTTNIGSSANANNAVTIEAGNNGKLQIGNGTAAHTIQIGTSASAAQTVTIGSTNAGSATTIQGSTVAITGTQTVTANASAGYASTIYNSNTGTDADGLLIKLGVDNASRSSSNYFIGFAGGDGTIAGKIQGSASAVAFTTNGADYAEYFKADPSDLPQAGELVTLDSSMPRGVRRATSGDTITGVISTAPGFIGNGPICDAGDSNCDSDYAKSNVLVSLTGQVPVKTNSEGGAIHIGDPIGASSVPGVATRATSGNIIGYALTEPDANGLVQVVINITNTDPTRDLQASGIIAQSLNLTDNAFITGNLNVSGDTVLSNLTVTGSQAITGNLTVVGLVNVTDIVVGGHIITSGNAPTITATANIGDGGQVQVSGNDTSGTITITVGQSTLDHPITAGDLATLTFTKAYGSNPRIMVTGNDGPSTAMDAFPDGVVTTGFSLSTMGIPAANTTYTFTYFTVQ